ncbi:MAG: ATP-binding cassette domain-containing protein [Cyclobacteriaceae bacterium]|nr:ATP-binding cassette domain-containing protein [Cyclobacteriaceae bacterium]
MSEPVLKAILRLFAIVAKDGEVTQLERDHILAFLHDHLGRKSVIESMAYFDAFAKELGADGGKNIQLLCQQINREVTQKQKAVVLLELMSVVLADGVITEKERQYVQTIGSGLNVAIEEINLMTEYILGHQRQDFNSPAILIIDRVKEPPGRCKHISRENLGGMIAILHLVQADMFFFKYIGTEDVYLNGVPQKSTNISPLARGSSIRWEGTNMKWEGMEPVYFGEILGQFKKPGSSSRTTFEAKNLSYQFKNGKLGLRNVSLNEESGNLIALMGASGAGKSTLLHVLNGSEKPSSGQVLLNSIDIHANPEKIEGVFGFVPQDDLLMEDLTVYQNLYFAGKLCFDNLKDSELNELVLKTISDLGLTEIKDLKVGSPLRKTISGGQRKRLNIGLELLREPSVLFLDEPTSGLSSRDSENIIELLKELALKGKLVFAVIHQPSSDIFKMFDRLVILDTGGYQIYYGNPVDAITFFKQNINLINSDQGECPECGNVNPEQIFNIIETKVLDDYGNFTNERKISPEQWNGFYTARVKPFSFTPSSDPPVSSLHRPNRLKQWQLFGLRDLLSKLSNKQYLAINLLEAPLLALILAFITYYYNTGDPTYPDYVFLRNINLPAYLFMSVIVALFMGLTVSAEEIIRDQKILKREAFLHLSRGSYLASKMAILFSLSAIQTFLFVWVGNTVLQIEGMLLIHWGILFTVSCFANMLGLNISSAFNSAVTIYILIPILLIPQLILSGVVVKFDKLNPMIGNQETVPLVGDLMASRWAFEAAMVAQFKDNRYEKEFYELERTIAESDYKRIYFIPTLESKLDFVHLNIRNPEADKSQVAESLKLLQQELDGELEIVGRKHFLEIALLQPETFDSAVYRKTHTFLQQLKQFYVNETNKASQAKQKKIQAMKDLYGGDEAYESHRRSYQNEAITVLVKNLEEPVRIIESNGRLVQKIYPIYKDPEPHHLIDFDAQFYLPAKHFLKAKIDTLYFNLAVIWAMSIVMYVTLYFDLLRKLLNRLENLSFRRK